MNIATQRMQREFNENAKSDESQKSLISIELVNNSLMDLKGRIAGNYYNKYLLFFVKTHPNGMLSWH